MADEGLLLQTRMRCEWRAAADSSSWRWADWLTMANATTDAGDHEPLHALGPVRRLNELQVASGGAVHVAARAICHVENLAFVNGQPVGSPRAAGAAKYRSEAGRIRKLMRLVESPAMSNARSKAAAYALPDALPGLTWADIPIANVTPLPQGGRSSSQRPFRRLPDLLIPSIPPNANVGHQGQIVYWAAQCIVPEHGHEAVTEADQPATRAARAPCGRTVLLPDRWLKSRSNTWAREAVRGVSAPVLDRRAWLPAPTTTGRTPSTTGSRTRSTGDGRETAYVGSFLLSPSNFGHPTTLPEEWFADSDSAAQMRSRLATVHNEALHQLRCRVPLCVTILRRPPPRRLIHEGTIADVLRTDFGRHAEVRIESFDGRKFAEQFGVMARTHVLVAPHGVRP